MSAADPKTLVLIVDDDQAIAVVLEGLLRKKGLRSLHASSAEAAIELLARQPIDVALVDLHMPGMGGMALLDVARQRFPDVPIAVLTAHGSIPLAVRALQAGAADFLEKPFDAAQLAHVLSRLAASRRATHVEPAGTIVGRSSAIVQLLQRVTRAAQSDATVLVRGESGTGKELVAREIHRQSRRSAAPLITVHCAAIPEPLLESELFGHSRGAFTGADRERRGRVELAHGGTLFFDELGDISPLIQTKLLRLIQERTFERVGEGTTRQADVRFVAATHQPLEDLVSRGKFREDLYYRLNVIPLVVPPLRDRQEDVPLLAAQFAVEVAESQRLPRRVFDADALSFLARHHWPGNVRELRNLVERLVVLANGERIRVDDVRVELAANISQPPPSSSAPPRRIELSREQLLSTLEKAGQNRALAARLLGVSRRTLYNRLHQFGMD
jgi:two-component system, NtrC family, response regulator AtoC